MRGLPPWARYLITSLFVFAGFQVRFHLDFIYPYPYLIFLPGIALASFIFNRGSGFFATFLSAGVAIYFFLEPRRSFLVGDVGAAISACLFVVVGMIIASIIEALRVTAEELATSNAELKQRRAELRDRVNELETIIEGAPDPIYLKDREGRYVRANAAAVRMFGVTRSAILGRRDSDFLPGEQARRFEHADRQVIDNQSPQPSEEPRETTSGMRWYSVARSPWRDADGELAGVVGIARDIDDRKRAEEELREADRRKELLLQDLNHRVKNHLQSLISLLSVSRRQNRDQGAREVLQGTITRLLVLSRVYDRLQLRSSHGASVALRPYMEAIVSEISGVILDGQRIVIGTDVEDMDIDSNRAVTLGLIANEALTNALKHAFPGARSGTVIVRFKVEDDEAELEIADDGIGSPPGGGPQGTGRRLIDALAQQLGGRVEWRGSSGTAIAVRFPLAVESPCAQACHAIKPLLQEKPG